MSNAPLYRLAARVAASAATVNLLIGCALTPDPQSPREYLDQTTAATVIIVARPMVFAHEKPELAVHMRDYVTLAAATIDRSGKTDYVVIAYFWSTFDAHGRAGAAGAPAGAAVMQARAAVTAAGSPVAQAGPVTSRGAEDSGNESGTDDLIIAADDRRIVLHLSGHSPRDAGIGEAIMAPPVQTVLPNVYRTDLATLRFLAAARNIAVIAGTHAVETEFPIWDDQRAALAAFVRQISGEQ